MEIIKFIEQFKKNAGSCYVPVLETVFTNGNCYWFACILTERFSSLNPVLYYLQIQGHFVVKINDRFYDITGEIHPEEIPVEWGIFKKKEPCVSERIYRNCALFEE